MQLAGTVVVVLRSSIFSVPHTIAGYITRDAFVSIAIRATNRGIMQHSMDHRVAYIEIPIQLDEVVAEVGDQRML